MTPSVHISLNVRNLDRSVDFYERFFGAPAKLESDYAKFVTRDPEIHLALEPGLEPGLEAAARPGALSHLGLRVGSTDEVERWKGDLRGRGLAIEEEERSECCYALQDKFWLTDPDGNRWEIYTVLQDVETMQPAAKTACCAR
jgi:catechol 2,3-dioxygenase-like lactoylglutathione lyase family enzyme